jgi:hypothetical protein
MDESAGQLGRRGFVLGVAGFAIAASATATASAQQPLSRAAGVAVLGEAAKALCLSGTSWVLVDEDGTIYPTTGLEGATVLDVSADDRGVLAVGSRPAPSGTEATIWRSADGVTWHEAMRMVGTNSEFTGVGFGPGTAMALGSALTEERAPARTIAARRWQRVWTEIQVTGLEPTAEQAITTLSGNRDGWIAASITQDGSTLYRSTDGSSWSTVGSGFLEDAAVQGVLLEAAGGVRWVANAIGGSAAITGKVGAGRQPVPVREDAHAVGAVWTRRGALSYWLVDGRLVTAQI